MLVDSLPCGTPEDTKKALKKFKALCKKHKYLILIEQRGVPPVYLIENKPRALTYKEYRIDSYLE